MPDELFLDKLIEGIASTAVREIMSELRPDNLFSEQFPELTSAMKSLEPKSIIKGLIADFTDLKL